MSTESDRRSIILVLEHVEEIRDGIEKLLAADGYRLIPAGRLPGATLTPAPRYRVVYINSPKQRSAHGQAG